MLRKIISRDGRLPVMFYKKSLFSLFFVFGLASVFANPQKMELISGQADLCHPDPKTVEIHSSTDKTILEWDQFSITPSEVTRFQLPSEKSTILNRVTGKELSSLNGLLESNGKVFLINPNGIIIGKEGMIKTAAFYASTLDVRNEDFLLEKEILFSGDSDQEIIHLGRIECSEGDAILLAKKVHHDGEIIAKKGTVALGAGREILLKPTAKERIFIKPSLSEKASPDTIGVTNTGKIESLRTEIKADGNLYALAIKDAGHIDALGSLEQNGEIFLFADDGVIATSSSLSAETGEIRILGNRVVIEEGAHISTSSDYAAGKILIGGDYQGKNENIPNSEFLFVAPRSVIEASSKKQGDGGEIILWSNHGTFFEGKISAEGKGEGHEGGFIEISAKEGPLEIPGTISALCENGKTGLLLLDPSNLTISAATTANIGTSGTNPLTYMPTGTSANLKMDDLKAALETSGGVNVIVTTASSQTEAGDLTVAVDLTWTTSNYLRLEADQDIIVNADIKSTVAGPITLHAKRNIVIEPSGTVSAGLFTGGDISLLTDTGDIQLSGKTDSTASIDGGGSIILDAANNFSLVGGTSSSADSDAEIFSSGGDIDIFAKTVSLRAGKASLGWLARCRIWHQGDGDINMAISGDLIELVGGIDPTSSGDVSACILHERNSPMKNITIDAPNAILTLAGGDAIGNAAADSRAYIRRSVNSGDVSITCDSIFAAGGTGVISNVFIDSEVSGNVTCTLGGDLDLIGGSGDASHAKIYVGLGDFTGAVKGDVNIFGGSGVNSAATEILPYTSIIVRTGNISLSSRDLTIFGGSAGRAKAFIFTSVSGNITLTNTGDIGLLGGSSTTTTSEAYIESTSGNISISGKNLTLLGGSGAGAAAFIKSDDNTLSVALSEDYYLLGGSHSGAQVYLESSGNMTLVGKDMDLLGGSKSDTGALVHVTGNNKNLTSTLSGTYRIYGGTSPVGYSGAKIEVDDGNADLTGANLILLGGSGSNSPADIHVTGAFTGNISGEVDLVAGVGSGTNHAEIKSVNGPIVLTAGDLLLQGGETTALYAKIYTTTAGTITINTGDIISLASRSIGPAQIVSIDDLSITAGGDVILLRNATLQNTNNPLTVIAGKSMILGTYSSIVNLDGSDLTLVVDNENPNFPDAGNNKLIMSPFATVTNTVPGGEARIFTSKLNRILSGAQVNSEPFFETLANTPQSQWGVYYPSSFFGGPGYTLFHKEYPDGLVSVAYGAEMSYRLDAWYDRMFVIDCIEQYINRSIQFSIYYDCGAYGDNERYRKEDKYLIKAFR